MTHFHSYPMGLYAYIWKGKTCMQAMKEAIKNPINIGSMHKKGLTWEISLKGKFWKLVSFYSIIWYPSKNEFSKQDQRQGTEEVSGRPPAVAECRRDGVLYYTWCDNSAATSSIKYK